MTTLESENQPDSPKKPDIGEEPIEKIFSVLADGIFKCSICEFQTGRKQAILRHYGSHEELQKHVSCTICGRIFQTSQHLKKHVVTHSWSKPFLCNDCDACYRHAGELQRHIRYKHTLEKPFKCTVCSYAAVERSKLALHMRGHTSERPYKCTHCTYASNDRSHLRLHLRTHTREHPYVCQICNADFAQGRSLRTHIQNAHSVKPPEYSCDTCHAVYPTMLTLEQHLQSLHAYIGPQMCTKCDASFNDLYTLNNHVKTHRRRTKSGCGICQHTTTKTQVNHKHHRHSMLECQECDSCFTSQAKLTCHVKKHHKTAEKHVCNNCGKSFPMKHNLVLHLKTKCNAHVPSKIRIQETNGSNTQVSNKAHIQANNASPNPTKITKNITVGDVIVLPEKGGQSYLFVEILSDEVNCSRPKVEPELTSSVKEEILKDFDIEDDNSIDIKLEQESDVEMTDEDEKPFLGF